MSLFVILVVLNLELQESYYTLFITQCYIYDEHNLALLYVTLKNCLTFFCPYTMYYNRSISCVTEKVGGCCKPGQPLPL